MVTHELILQKRDNTAVCDLYYFYENKAEIMSGYLYVLYQKEASML
jgi:hypothetical protein